MREIKVGEKYRHFKGDVMEILAIAKHTETLEDLVIYKHYDKLWARPIDMFNSLVDKKSILMQLKNIVLKKLTRKLLLFINYMI